MEAVPVVPVLTVNPAKVPDSKLLAVTIVPGKVLLGAATPAEQAVGAGVVGGGVAGAALAGPDTKASVITGTASALMKPNLNSRFTDLSSYFNQFSFRSMKWAGG